MKAYQFSFPEVWKALPYPTEGAALTIGISILAMLCGLALGLGLALISQLRFRLACGGVVA